MFLLLSVRRQRTNSVYGLHNFFAKCTNISSLNSSLSGLAGMFTFLSVKHVRFQATDEAEQGRMLLWFYTDDALQSGYRIDFNSSTKRLAFEKVEGAVNQMIGYVNLT